MNIRIVTVKKIDYKLTFDEYGVLDTTRRIDNNVEMNGGQAVVQFFVRHQEKILRYQPVAGLAYKV